MDDQTILLPSQLKVVKEEGNQGSYDIEGLYPGYGHTLGNSLRRIILSSLPGSAMTSLKIDGVNHEFSTIEGVKEDVITLLLNLKQVRYHLASDEPQTVTLSVKGAKVVTAGDISVSGGVEILNPEQPICTLTAKNSSINITMHIERGLGFVAREKLHKEKVDIGTLVVDAIFTPIRKVSYEVENMRVGERTDHNRLRLSIETDGTLTPREALERSIKIMIRQLRSILDLKEMMENIPVIDMSEVVVTDPKIIKMAEETADQSDILKTRIDSLELSNRTLNALSNASIRTVGGLVQKTEEDLLDLEGIGNKGVEEIKSTLANFGMGLRD